MTTKTTDRPPFVFNWGIIGTGQISTKFVKDILIDPTIRDVHDVVHRVVAVGSRSLNSAQSFIDTVAGGDNAIKAHGSYEELYADKRVEAVYIGTPHTYHYENAITAIQAGKHLLIEKPITVNSAELQALINAAKEKGVFIMEAMWTRFHPLVKEVKRILNGGSLGRPIAVHADQSGDFDLKNIPSTHRILDPALGGGALLDLGPYALVWAVISLFEDDNNKGAFPEVAGAMLKSPETGVDVNTSFTLTFPNLPAQAVLSCNINVDRLQPGATIRCERGAIDIASPLYCPKSITIHRHSGKGVDRQPEEIKLFEYVGGGWHFQADELARCVKAGKLESDLWGHDKSLLEMFVFDKVREQGGYVFPPGVEKVQ